MSRVGEIFFGFHAALKAECSDLVSRILFPDFSAYRIRKPDIIAAAVFFTLFLALYAMLAVRLAHGDFLYYYNYGFDLDPARFVATIAGDFDLYDELHIKGGPKHPLMVLLRPVAWPFEILGFDVRTSASLAKAVFGAGTVVLVFAFFRMARIPLMETASLTVLYGVSGAQLFNAFIVDSYGFALFFIVFVWCLTPLRMSDPDCFPLLRLIVAVLNIGTTVTNGIHSAVSEGLVWCRRLGLVNGLSRMLAFLVFVGIVFAVLVVIVWNDRLLSVAADPIGAVKFLYWQQTKGPTLGIEHVLIRFFGHSFVSPQFTVIRLPEGVDMHDFRGFYTTGLGVLTFSVWIVFLAVSTGLGVMQKQTRPLILTLIGVIVFNVWFHLSYQYRGSIYLYAAHSHFVIFALMLGAASFFSRRSLPLRVCFVGGVLMLTVLMGTINLERAAWFVTAFDNLDPQTPRLLLED